jgi:hypothetical protein
MEIAGQFRMSGITALVAAALIGAAIHSLRPEWFRVRLTASANGSGSTGTQAPATRAPWRKKQVTDEESGAAEDEPAGPPAPPASPRKPRGD